MRRAMLAWTVACVACAETTEPLIGTYVGSMTWSVRQDGATTQLDPKDAAMRLVAPTPDVLEFQNFGEAIGSAPEACPRNPVFKLGEVRAGLTQVTSVVCDVKVEGEHRQITFTGGLMHTFPDDDRVEIDMPATVTWIVPADQPPMDGTVRFEGKR